MFKYTLIIVGILFVLLIAAISIGVYYFFPSKDRVLKFIKENPTKSAITVFKNDSLITDINSDKIMPLASTVKIIIAIEYAEQAASNKIDPNEMIDIEEIDYFYAKNTDGGAHPAWKNSLKNSIIDGQVPIKEIAKGMIRYSSNANTEWLQKKLGLDNINNRLDSLGIKNHTEIYYLVSSLYVQKEMYPDLNGESLKDSLRNISREGYIETINNIHSKLLADTTYRNELKSLPLSEQQVWSDRLPASTTFEYAHLMKKLNSKTYFSKQVYSYLDEVMEGLMESEANKKQFLHAGTKGGSTAFVLTTALYATDKQGNTFEIAYFFDGLGPIESTQLNISLNDFELALLTNDEFLEKFSLVLN
ncbi:MAG: serine hydrolase [Balneolaceae bacterium]